MYPLARQTAKWTIQRWVARFCVIVGVAIVGAGCVKGPMFHDDETLNTLLDQYADQNRAEKQRRASAEARAIRLIDVARAPYSHGYVVSVDLINAPLSTVVGTILQRADASYNLSGVVLSGNVTAKFRSLPLTDALDQLLAHRGLSVRLDGDVIRLRYGAAIKPAPVKAVVKAETSKSSSNDAGSDSEKEETKTDKNSDSDNGESKSVANSESKAETTYEEVSLRNIKMEDAVTMLKAIFPQREGGIQFGSLPELNAIYVAGPASDVASARAVLDRADREVPHVLIEALVVGFYSQDLVTLKNSITNAAIGDFNGIKLIPDQTGGNITFTFLEGANSMTTVTKLVDLLVSANKAQILSRPYMTARSRETAKIEIVEESFVIVQRTEEGATISTNDSIAAGVTLQIVPTVQANDIIRLQMQIEDSDFTEQNATGLISKRRNSAQTAMNVHSGQTIVIGGLNHARRGSTNKGLPWLRNVPVVNLFTAGQEGIDEAEEVVVYLTPRIWSPELEAPVANAEGLYADNRERSRFERRNQD